MCITRAIRSVRLGAAIAGIAISVNVMAQPAPASAASKVSYKVKCDLLTTSLTCKATDGSFTFSATMDRSVSAGTNGDGTMTFDSDLSRYKNIVCSIDLDPQTGKVHGDIWCGARHAVLDQPIRNSLFGNKVRGQGTFR
ncbi:hypothetical protein BOSP111201_04260 [Bordetella sputigena]|uniref:hypothetical protein n=1 Tax=Bordetella sputigena TaxID=1416810 RepID=UPI0039F14002